VTQVQAPGPALSPVADPRKDINFVPHSGAESIGLLGEGKIDAYLGFPPEPQALRAQKIGHVVVNRGLDRP